MTIDQFGAVVAVLSLFGGFLTFLLSEFRKWRIDSASEIARWQSVVVYTAIRDAGANGIAFKALYQEYLNKARNWERREIGKSLLTENELIGILVSLKGTGSIIELSPGLYSTEGLGRQLGELIALAGAEMGERRNPKKLTFGNKSDIEFEASYLVFRMPWTYNFNEVCTQVADKLGIDLGIVRLALSNSYDIQKCRVDEKQRLGFIEPIFSQKKNS